MREFSGGSSLSGSVIRNGRALSSLCALALLVLLALAAAPASAAEVSPFEVRGYSHDFGLPTPEAEEHLETQRDAAGIVRQLRGGLGSRFAGVWFDNEVGEFVVPLMSGAGTEAVRDQFSRVGLQGEFRTTPARASWDKLEVAQEGIDAALLPQIRAGLVQTSLDPRTNSVQIDVAAGIGETDLSLIRQQATDAQAPVNVIESPQNSFHVQTMACRTAKPRACGRPLRGGVSLTQNVSEGFVQTGQCTAGFKATDSAGNRYMLTAGHCAAAGSKWGSEDASLNFHPIGSVTGYVFPGGDWAKIKANGSEYWDKSPWPSEVAHYWEDQERAITAESSSYVGEYVCHSGTQTGTSCGNVSRLNYTVNAEGGIVIYHETEFGQVCSYSGDSGGPVFAGNTALGLYSASTGESSPGACDATAYYVEITEATNSLGVSVGPRISPPPPPPPPQQPPIRTAFVDASNANSLTAWEYGASGWQQIFLWGHPVAAGTKPFVMSYEGTKHIFFVDASRGNQITEWSWNPSTGWQQAFLETDPVAAGSSPTGAVINGYPELFFSDAATNRSITALVRISGAWYPAKFYGDSVAPNTSPSAIISNGQPQIYFNDGSKGNTMAAWTWNSASGWQQSFFYGDTIAANTSPSAIANNNQAQAYFNDASKGNTISVWIWAPGILQQSPFGGDALATNSSPSAISANGSPHIYFADASKGNTMAVWVWSTANLQQSFFYGDAVAANTSPSAVLTSGGQDQVFFSDESTNKSLALWEWGSTLLQTRLYGHLALAGTGPGA